ncbi:hypothetical protein CDCA_CDCA10G3043 [Cyanidium caldarium]|uniref:Succinate-semialdehyde dehydrogenase, mitochondrial n=1 Tax=Cyanidium caldarium TaxID=2771 RepID=A0AAV9IYY6_CYACA|nr:hypothetical protein CDCA_CDCA10G3043 [Cyanidium caldarium]
MASSALEVVTAVAKGGPRRVGHWIRGAAVVDAPAYYKVRNPANDDVVAEVADGDASTVDEAIRAAQEAYPAWRDKPVEARAKILRRWYDLVVQRSDALGRLISLENGKPLGEAVAEVRYGASFIEWFSEEARRAYGDVIPTGNEGDRRAIVLRQPLGVCAAITPWNFPNAMLTRKVAPALAAGNTMVARPSELTPLSALALAELATEAGVPAGVFNVVSGSRASVFGDAFANSCTVRMLSFTGSTRVGRLLLAQCAPSVKRTEMELGGLAPLIVFDDADVEVALNGLWSAKMRNSGQTCISPNRIYVQSGVYDTVVERLAARARRARVGPGLESGTEVGPLIHAAAVDKVERHVQDCVQRGAQVLAGGKRMPELGDNFYAPTVLRDVPHDALVAREETFGPVIAVMRFETEDEVVRLANDTEYGLSSYAFTRDLGRAFRMAQQLEAGIVGVNEGVVSNAAMPFGGVKQSGHGREGSKYGLDSYTNLKYVLMRY